MAVYSVNQATQFYVVKGKSVSSSVSDNKVRITGLGINGDLATDLIDKAKILSKSSKESAELAPKVTKQTIKVTAASAGEYIMRVLIKNAFSDSPSGMYIKHASAYVGTDASAAAIAAKLAASLQMGLKRDIEPAFEVAYTKEKSDTITLTPIPTEWVKGRRAVVVPEIKVELVPVETKDNVYVEEAAWATVTAADASEDDAIKALKLGSKKLADLEYFCLGERGDMYRGIGYPNSVETKGEIDEKVDYHIITIHYYDSLSNEAVQKSEKTAVFACTSDTVAAVKGLFGIAE